MVVTDDNFASIVSAVEEGRIVYDNIKKLPLSLNEWGQITAVSVTIVIAVEIDKMVKRKAADRSQRHSYT